MASKLTLRDVAQAAGVSEMTASRALRNAGEVSVRTKERVEQAAKELGYVQNKIAGALASKRVDLVGVIIPSVKSYVFSEVLDGISDALEPSPLRPVFGLSKYDFETEADVIREMLSWRPSGLIVAGLEHNQLARRILAEADTPIVEIMDTDGTPIDSCVGISHHAAGYQMAQAILDKGYKKIGFIGTKMESDYRAAKRVAGFTACLKDNGTDLAAVQQYNHGSSVQKGRNMTASLLEKCPEMDFVYCSTDVLAAGAYLHCLANQISVPDQLGIAGFNNLPIIQGFPVELATTDSLRFDIGQKAAQHILDRNQKDSDNKSVLIELEPKVLAGQSL